MDLAPVGAGDGVSDTDEAASFDGGEAEEDGSDHGRVWAEDQDSDAECGPGRPFWDPPAGMALSFGDRILGKTKLTGSRSKLKCSRPTWRRYKRE